MPRFVALLRGVNVGKGNLLPMVEFKALLQVLGFTEVSTLLNSGNAVFSSAGRSAAKHSASIAQALEQTLGLSVATVVKSGEELSSIVAANPIDVPDSDHSRFLVAFVQEPDALQALQALQSLAHSPERLAIGEQAAYLHCANGILESKVGAALLGKVGKAVTTRNWATVLKLLALSRASAAPRSTGAPTAGRQARAVGTRYIFTGPGLASCHRRPVRSNVGLAIRETVMPKKPTFPSTTLVDGLKTVSSALDEIADASKTLAAREKRVQALVATLFRMTTGFEDQAALLKVQLAMQRENQVFTSVSNVLKTRRDTAKNAIGNVM